MLNKYIPSKNISIIQQIFLETQLWPGTILDNSTGYICLLELSFQCGDRSSKLITSHMTQVCFSVWQDKSVIFLRGNCRAGWGKGCWNPNKGGDHFEKLMFKTDLKGLFSSGDIWKKKKASLGRSKLKPRLRADVWRVKIPVVRTLRTHYRVFFFPHLFLLVGG